MIQKQRTISLKERKYSNLSYDSNSILKNLMNLNKIYQRQSNNEISLDDNNNLLKTLLKLLRPHQRDFECLKYIHEQVKYLDYIYEMKSKLKFDYYLKLLKQLQFEEFKEFQVIIQFGEYRKKFYSILNGMCFVLTPINQEIAQVKEKYVRMEQSEENSLQEKELYEQIMFRDQQKDPIQYLQNLMNELIHEKKSKGKTFTSEEQYFILQDAEFICSKVRRIKSSKIDIYEYLKFITSNQSQNQEFYEVNNCLELFPYFNLVNILMKDQSFGEIAIQQNGCRTATVVAIQPTQLITLDHNQYKKFLQLHQSDEYQQYYNFFKNIPLFKSWDDKELQILMLNKKLKKYTYQQPIFDIGDDIDSFFIIYDGEVELYANILNKSHKKSSIQLLQTQTKNLKPFLQLGKAQLIGDEILQEKNAFKKRTYQAKCISQSSTIFEIKSSQFLGNLIKNTYINQIQESMLEKNQSRVILINKKNQQHHNDQLTFKLPSIKDSKVSMENLQYRYRNIKNYQNILQTKFSISNEETIKKQIIQYLKYQKQSDEYVQKSNQNILESIDQQSNQNVLQSLEQSQNSKCIFPFKRRTKSLNNIQEMSQIATLLRDKQINTKTLKDLKADYQFQQNLLIRKKIVNVSKQNSVIGSNQNLLSRIGLVEKIDRKKYNPNQTIDQYLDIPYSKYKFLNQQHFGSIQQQLKQYKVSEQINLNEHDLTVEENFQKIDDENRKQIQPQSSKLKDLTKNMAKSNILKILTQKSIKQFI